MTKINYTYAGTHYRLIRQEGHLALYEGTRPGRAKPICYELLQYHYHGESTLPKGNTLEAGLKPPSPSDWGKSGWTLTNLESANAKMDRMLEMETMAA